MIIILQKYESNWLFKKSYIINEVKDINNRYLKLDNKINEIQD